MVRGRREDEWDRAATLASVFSGEPHWKFMPDFDGKKGGRSDVLPYDPKILQAIQDSGKFCA